jgi:hypothetical protein
MGMALSAYYARAVILTNVQYKGYKTRQLGHASPRERQPSAVPMTRRRMLPPFFFTIHSHIITQYSSRVCGLPAR